MKNYLFYHKKNSKFEKVAGILSVLFVGALLVLGIIKFTLGVI